MSRHPSVSHSGTVAPVGDITRAGRFLLLMAGVVTLAATVVRTAAKATVGAVSLAAGLAKRASRGLSGALSWLGDLATSIIRADWAPWTHKSADTRQYESVARRVYTADGQQYLSVARGDYESLSGGHYLSVKD